MPWEMKSEKFEKSEKSNAFFSTKNFKNKCSLGERSILDALNSEIWGVKIHKCALLLDFLALFSL